MTGQSEQNAIRLRRLEITNFKGIDRLELDFPQPVMADDPDVLVMGSRNGLGKTSVLEACALLSLALRHEQREWSKETNELSIVESFVGSGGNQAAVTGYFNVGNEDGAVSVDLHRHEKQLVTHNKKKLRVEEVGKAWSYNSVSTRRFLDSLVGKNEEPFVCYPFLYLHSFRRVSMGRLGLAELVVGDKNGRYKEFEASISVFKMLVLRVLMGRSGLMEDPGDDQSKEILDQLNTLMRRYAEGTIEKLRPALDGRLELLISPVGGGGSFAFDGLSSGQKEIISTLFLIWYYTHEQPGIVLIDEPELHLNAEWHRDFIRQVSQLVPGNQYIIATHSEDIFGSVEEDRRILLIPGKPDSPAESMTIR